MDGARFDTLARSLTAAGSRRRALATALSSALGILGLARSDEAAAGGKCKPACTECESCKKGKCHKTKHGKVCKKGKCQAKTAGTACTAPAGGTCQSGTCTCPGALTSCGGTCVNIQTDRAHCGGCGTTCTPTQVCQGSCFPRSTCPETITSVCSLDPSGTSCGSNCYCGRSTEGNLLCFANETFCTTLRACLTSANCPAGQACVDVSGCCGTPLPAGAKTCVARCAAPTAAIAAADGGGRVGE